MKLRRKFKTDKGDFILTLEVKDEFITQRDWITLKPVNSKQKVVSISGDLYFEDEIINSGQVLHEIPELENVPEELMEVYYFWKNFHLNDLVAGTFRQMEAIEKSGLKDYDEIVDFLIKRKLQPDRGYRYGSDWLFKKVPEASLNRIIEIFKNQNF